MTRAERRELAMAVAFAPIQGTSVELMDRDRENIRDEVAIAIGERMKFGGDAFLSQVAALRMTEPEPAR